MIDTTDIRKRLSQNTAIDAKEIQALCDEVESNQWIDVNDRMPDIEDDIADVLIAFGNSVKSGIFVMHGDEAEGRFYCDASSYHTKGVTHWKPLPKPPSQ